MRMQGILYHRHTITLMVILTLLCLIPNSAWADLTTFFQGDPKNGKPTHYCDNIGAQYIISTVICQFLLIIDQILVAVFNGIQSALIPFVQAMLTLYIAVFGAQLLMGTARMQARDILGRLIKIAAVWSFSTDINYSVRIAFNFYIGLISDGGQALINAVYIDNYGPLCVDPSIPSPMQLPNQMPSIQTSDMVDASNLMPVFTFFDQLIYCAFVGTPGNASIKIVGFFLAMVAIYPPLFGIFTWWATTTFYAIARLVLSFLTALAAIAFLISLAPLFLSLMLFQATSYLFDNWLRYLTAYSVQIVISFGITVLWVITMLHFVLFFNDLADLIYPFQPGEYAGNYLNKSDTWAICDAQYDGFDANGNPIRLSRPFCWACGSEPCDATGYFIDNNTGQNKPDHVDRLIPPSSIISHKDFLSYAFYNLIALLAISFAFSKLLEEVRGITAKIVGSAPTPQFLGGLGSSKLNNAFGNQAKPAAPPPRATQPAPSPAGATPSDASPGTTPRAGVRLPLALPTNTSSNNVQVESQITKLRMKEQTLDAQINEATKAVAKGEKGSDTLLNTLLTKKSANQQELADLLKIRDSAKD